MSKTMMRPESWRRFVLTLTFVATIIQVVALGAGAPGGGTNRSPVPHDWSHRHLIFSTPVSTDHARSLRQDPRYMHQWLRRNSRQEHSHKPPDAPAPDAMHRDWGVSLGAGGTVGTEMFPAKFSFDVSAAPNCANDFVVYNTSLVGSILSPSIVAFNQLYSTQGSVGGFCNQNGPSVMWSYNTNPVGDVTGQTTTSTILSLDGTKVMYVETRPNANGGSILHLLKWKSGQGTVASPAAPDQIVANWASCTGGNSCIVNITLNGAQPATNSAPFYDYTADVLYAGDNNGVLHKFAPVLSGTPAEVTTGGWPITVNGGTTLSSPVFDSVSGNIFVGDSSGRVSYVRETGSTAGACGSGGTPCLGTPSQSLGGNIVDAPIVDSSAHTVFVFDGTETLVGDGSVFQFNTALSTASKVVVDVGASSGVAGAYIHSGAFDDAYMSSVTSTGHFYVCAKNGTNTNRPAIHRIAITNGIMSSVSDGKLTLASADGEQCSPVSEVYNTATSTDWIFFSVGKNNNQTAAGCSATAGITGCLMSLNLTALGGAWPPAAVTNGYPLPDASGIGASTSGIVVDNVANTSTFAQASSLYFSFIPNSVAAATCNGTTGVGCAVKLTQSLLQ